MSLYSNFPGIRKCSSWTSKQQCILFVFPTITFPRQMVHDNGVVGVFGIIVLVKYLKSTLVLTWGKRHPSQILSHTNCAVFQTILEKFFKPNLGGMMDPKVSLSLLPTTSVQQKNKTLIGTNTGRVYSPRQQLNLLQNAFGKANYSKTKQIV